MSAPLYTTSASSTGDGRAEGRAVTDDGLLDVTPAVPTAMGGPSSLATHGNVPLTTSTTVA
ncbi:MAG TPA: hypothetical protein VGC45_00620 [Gryllotalpicola sp.]